MNLKRNQFRWDGCFPVRINGHIASTFLHTLLRPIESDGFSKFWNLESFFSVHQKSNPPVSTSWQWATREREREREREEKKEEMIERWKMTTTVVLPQLWRSEKASLVLSLIPNHECWHSRRKSRSLFLSGTMWNSKGLSETCNDRLFTDQDTWKSICRLFCFGWSEPTISWTEDHWKEGILWL